MDMTTPMKQKPLVDATCKLGKKGCFEDGRCHAIGDCENKIVTNADLLRAQNDHELADTIANFVSEIDNGDVRYSDDPNDWLEWLERPAEET